MSIFPNVELYLCNVSPFVKREFGSTNVLRHRPRPEEARDFRIGMVEACTATDEEIEERASAGEFGFDVIDEHMSRIWFCDRESFRAAWRVARLICNRNVKLKGIDADEAYAVKEIDGQAIFGLCISASEHHVGKAAMPRPAHDAAELARPCWRNCRRPSAPSC
ncbi:hypothetical protein [Paracoccus aminovorans]|uniref:hypothetical protein n=1 Tax=Paracoccus aminovorans TaxID=34004 RepID=UPI000A6DD9D4|nr:hypothetical protein [Paracoccus aminovorans]MDQ7775393.1 hypothetical protein [Paracoccus aminovorans]